MACEGGFPGAVCPENDNEFSCGNRKCDAAQCLMRLLCPALIDVGNTIQLKKIICLHKVLSSRYFFIRAFRLT